MPGGKAAAGRKERFLFSASRDEKPPGKELKKITTERVMANQGMDNKCHVRHHVAFELGLGARPPPSKGTMVVCRSTDLEVLVHMQTEHPKSNAKIAISENFIHLYERGGRYPVVRTKDGRVFLVLQFDQKTLQELKQQMNLPKHHTRHVDLDIHLSVTSRGVSYYHISAVQLFAKNEGYKNTRRSKEPSPAPSAAAAAAATGGAARGGKGGKGASTMSDQHRLLLAQQQQQQQQQASQMYLQQFQQQQLQQLQQLQQQQQQQQQQQKQHHHHHQQQQALPPRRRSQRLSADRMPGMSTAATSSSSFPFPDPNEIFGYGRPKRQSASQRGGAQGQQPPHSARSIGSLGGLFSPTMQMDTGGSGGAGNSVPLFSPSFLNYGGVPLPTPTEDLEMPSPFNRLSFDESYGSGSGLLASLGDAGGSGAAAAAAGDGSQQSQSQQQQQPDSALFAMAPFQSNGMAAPFPPATAKSSAASDTGTPNVPLATSTSSAPARRSSMRSSTSSHSSKRRRKEPHLPAPLSLGSISNKAAPAASSPTTRSVRAAAAAASSASAASDITAGPPSAMLPIPPTPSSAVQPAQIPITPATGQAPGAEHINAASVLASIKSTPPSTPQGGGAPAASAGTNGGRFSFERRSSTGSNGTRKRKRRGSSAATTPTATN